MQAYADKVTLLGNKDFKRKLKKVEKMMEGTVTLTPFLTGQPCILRPCRPMSPHVAPCELQGAIVLVPFLIACLTDTFGPDL